MNRHTHHIPISWNCYAILVTLLLIASLPHAEATGNGNSANDFMPADYNPELRPNFGRMTDDVLATLYVHSFGPVDEKEMSVSVDIYLRLMWVDKRLQELYNKLYEYNIANEDDTANNDNKTMTRKRRKREQIYLGGQTFDRIWKPDFYFPDAIKVERPVVNTGDSVQLRLASSGGVSLSLRLMTEFRCSMPLHFFPMDTQSCDLCLSQYKYPESEQNISWYTKAPQKTRNLNSPKFIVAECLHQKHRRLKNYDDYPNICVELKFWRKVSQFVVIMFLPSILLTILSFLNFWIDKGAVPARASLSITTILAQITLMTGLAGKFPSGSDIRLADIYLIINFFFTFSTLIEFAIVSYPGKRSVRQKASAVMRTTNEVERNALIGDENYDVKVQQAGEKPKKKSLPLLARVKKWWEEENADKISRILFPLSFVVWHVCYFAVSLILTDRFEINPKMC